MQVLLFLFHYSEQIKYQGQKQESCSRLIMSNKSNSLIAPGENKDFWVMEGPGMALFYLLFYLPRLSRQTKKWVIVKACTVFVYVLVAGGDYHSNEHRENAC